MCIQPGKARSALIPLGCYAPTCQLHRHPAVPVCVVQPCILQQVTGATVATMQQQEATLDTNQAVGTPRGWYTAADKTTSLQQTQQQCVCHTEAVGTVVDSVIVAFVGEANIRWKAWGQQCADTCWATDSNLE